MCVFIRFSLEHKSSKTIKKLIKVNWQTFERTHCDRSLPIVLKYKLSMSMGVAMTSNALKSISNEHFHVTLTLCGLEFIIKRFLECQCRASDYNNE